MEAGTARHSASHLRGIEVQTLRSWHPDIQVAKESARQPSGQDKLYSGETRPGRLPRGHRPHAGSSPPCWPARTHLVLREGPDPS